MLFPTHLSGLRRATVCGWGQFVVQRSLWHVLGVRTHLLTFWLECTWLYLLFSGNPFSSFFKTTKQKYKKNKNKRFLYLMYVTTTFEMGPFSFFYLNSPTDGPLSCHVQLGSVKSSLSSLTLCRSQHLCNLQWPAEVFGDALSCWLLSPPPSLHPLVPVKPGKCQFLQLESFNGRVMQTNAVGSSARYKNHIGVLTLPCHSWHFLSRCGYTWASPWQPPTTPAQCPPSTETWVSSWPAPPAGGGPAGPLSRLTGWGWGGWSWRGCLSLGGDGVNIWMMQLRLWVEVEVIVGIASNDKNSH